MVPEASVTGGLTTGKTQALERLQAPAQCNGTTLEDIRNGLEQTTWKLVATNGLNAKLLMKLHMLEARSLSAGHIFYFSQSPQRC